MIEATPAAVILRHLFARHRKRFPADEHVTCRIVEPPAWSMREDCVRVQVDRIRGYGIGAFYRHASADVSLLGYYHRHDKGALVAVFAEALERLVRVVLQPDLPTFRIHRDARRLSHRREATTPRAHPQRSACGIRCCRSRAPAPHRSPHIAAQASRFA